MNAVFQTVDTRSLFDQPIAEQIWRQKYQYRSAGREIDLTVRDTWRRVARAVAAREDAAGREAVEARFLDALDGFRLLPGGRILAGAGTTRDVTLFNTFVMRTIPDSVEGIMDTIKDAALTMKMGGGIGFDFSTIRPRGTRVRGLDCPAAGPLAAMDICDAVCRMLVSGMGRGAMMATLRCDHPDIMAFVSAKSDPARFRNFNVSVLVTDRFLDAVRANGAWPLVWAGQEVRQIPARDLWSGIMSQTYAAAEPGVLFIDRINGANPLAYLENITATNSCAEQPLPPNGACPLASVNLAQLVVSPFTEAAELDVRTLRELATTAVRFLDNVIDASRIPVPAQRDEILSKRRIGIGVTGVGDALAMLGVRYGSDAAAAHVSRWMRVVQNACYRASALLARDRGPFPLFDVAQHMAQPGVQALDPDVRELIARHGLRNGTLTTIAPTGTISMLAGNVSSGIEPIFATSYSRRVTRSDGSHAEERVEDYAVRLHRRLYGSFKPLPDSFVTALDLSPEDHVRMQAAAQEWVDTGISKTVNCPENIDFSAFEGLYLEAHARGCKGCTTYRPNAVTGAVLSA